MEKQILHLRCVVPTVHMLLQKEDIKVQRIPLKAINEINHYINDVFKERNKPYEIQRDDDEFFNGVYYDLEFDYKDTGYVIIKKDAKKEELIQVFQVGLPAEPMNIINSKEVSKTILKIALRHCFQDLEKDFDEKAHALDNLDDNIEYMKKYKFVQQYIELVDQRDDKKADKDESFMRMKRAQFPICEHILVTTDVDTIYDMYGGARNEVYQCIKCGLTNRQNFYIVSSLSDYQRLMQEYTESLDMRKFVHNPKTHITEESDFDEVREMYYRIKMKKPDLPDADILNIIRKKLGYKVEAPAPRKRGRKSARERK